MISRTIKIALPISIDMAFDYLVFFKDCDRWMEPKDWHGIFFHVSKNAITGLDVANPNPKLEPIHIPILELEKPNKVVYGSSRACPENVGTKSLVFFPFKEMSQSLNFLKTPDGSLVEHTINITPNGIFGHFTCRLVLFPLLLKDLKAKFKVLQYYLKNR